MEVCDSDFLNLDEILHADTPQLSRCFRDTALVWFPAVVLIALTPFEFNRFRHANLKCKQKIPWNSFNIIRLLLVCSLSCMKLLELSTHVHDTLAASNNMTKFQPIDGSFDVYLDSGKSPSLSALLAPIIQLVSYLILAAVYVHQRKCGVHTSSSTWFYLLASTLCSAADYYSVIGWPSRSLVVASIDYMHFPALVLLFLLECQGDMPELDPDRLGGPGDATRPLNPEAYASFCSKITFWWFNRFLWYGYRSRLRVADLWQTLARDRTSKLAPALFEQWLRKPDKKMGTSKRTTYMRGDGVSYEANDMMSVLIGLFSRDLLFAALLKLMQDLLQYLTPVILKALLRYLKSDDDPHWHGLFLAMSLMVFPTFQVILNSNHIYRIELVATQTRAMIMGAVYRKAVVLSGSSRQQSTSGEIVNLMSVDAQRFSDLLIHANLIWSTPFQVILATTMIYMELGWPVFVGLFSMCIFVPIMAFVAKGIKFTQTKLMRTKDERIKQMNEILNGIKVIKLYAWESSFMSSLFQYRDKELAFLGKILTLDAYQVFLWNCSPFVMACVTFACYLGSDSSNVLDAEKAFVSISLFNLLRMPITIVPQLLGSFVLTKVSSQRLSRFLNSDELVEYVTRNEDTNAITIEAATMAWKPAASSEAADDKLESQATLKGVSLKVRPGSFVAVVGQVASGKSSLIGSILGEMHRISGSFNIRKSSSIAYVPQGAFIQNMSLRDNILFGRAYERDRYEQVLESCSLLDDLAIVPGGDEAEIGEKGINLSGGQKQRVSLARACYSNSDIYLLDDPLSALDSHVAKHVYDQVLSSSSGLLKEKTRVLVTNALFVVPHVDQVVVLEGGRVVESGEYEDLMRNERGVLAEMMRQYNGNQEKKSREFKPSEEVKLVARETLDAKKRSQSVGAGLEGESCDKMGKLVDEEKMVVGNVGWRVYVEYFLHSYTPKWLATIFVCLCLGAAFNVATNFWLSSWSSDSMKLADEANSSGDTMRMLVYVSLGATWCFMVLMGSFALRQASVRAARELHASLLKSVMHSPMLFFDTTPLGRIVNRFAKDFDVVDSSLNGCFRSWLNSLLNIIGAAYIICYSFPSLLALFIPMTCFYLLITRVFIAATRQLKRMESVTRSPIYSNFNETLAGVGSIRAYNCVNRFIDYSDELIDTNQACRYPSNVANRWLMVRLEFCGNLLTFSVALVAATYKVAPETAGLAIAFSLLVTPSLSWLVLMSSDLETNIVSVERILEYMNNNQEDLWIKNESRPPSDWPTSGAISFRHYSTRYRPDTDLVLRDISIGVRPREKIGVVGRTGSGKSSLSLSLFRIIEPALGSIAIDSLDLLNFGLHDIRSRLTIIPQDPVLFSGSLRFNLDPLELYADQDIWRALDLAHLRHHVGGLQAGLDHQVSEYGENFSVGQRQLICLARAILRKTKILVLDEATASVDLETDNVVQKTIRSVFADCTIITIAHRLHTIMDSDRILVLDCGRVLELGRPEELLARAESAFASLVRDAGLDLDQLKSSKSLSTRL